MSNKVGRELFPAPRQLPKDGYFVARVHAPRMRVGMEPEKRFRDVFELFQWLGVFVGDCLDLAHAGAVADDKTGRFAFISVEVHLE